MEFKLNKSVLVLFSVFVLLIGSVLAAAPVITSTAVKQPVLM
jgi:hypothetical protein